MVSGVGVRIKVDDILGIQDREESGVGVEIIVIGILGI